MTGTQYLDANGNGSLDAGEPGIAGVEVYADLDGDGTLDPGEPTGTSDETGFYRILDVPAGSFPVREVPRPGWRCSQPDPCAEAGIGPVAAEVLELATRCLTSTSVQRALGADRYEREVPFSAVLDDGTHLAGRMDLVYRDGDELVVVDFKTDDVTTAAELDAATVKHSGQAVAYAIATERGTGLPVREVVFVYPRADAERTLRRADLPAVLVAGPLSSR